MIHLIQTYIQRHGLLQEGARVLVALSGGADSVCLLHALHRLGYTCVAAHCNFHLRGEESDRDELFVRRWCADLGIALHVTSFRTEAYAQEHGISIEMAARELRYDWFEELRQAEGCEAIAVAHHQNDQAETLLLNLSRGTGLRGLGGIRSKNGYVVRPLLCLTRADILRYTQQAGLDFVTDSTNADTTIRRNGYRALLQAATEQDIRHYAEAAERMQAYHSLLQSLLLGTPIEDEAQRTLLYELLQPYGFNASQAADILQALPSSGKRFEAPAFTATIDRGTLTLKARQSQADEVPPTLLRAIRPRLPKEHLPKATDSWALLDADALQAPLTLRHWQPGDSFFPITSGKRIRKKLQDFFTDAKLSVEEKNAVWLLCSGNEIAWVVGHRLDDRFKLTPATTRVAELSIEE